MKFSVAILSATLISVTFLMAGKTSADQEEHEPTEPHYSKPPAAKWKGAIQKRRCESYLRQLRQSFRQARYASILGDSCSSAQHSIRFLDLVETCKQDCPEGYLDISGISGRVLRNIEWLKESSGRRCSDASISVPDKSSKQGNSATEDSSDNSP